ncbi:ATPase, T2SS/T4P/T4SS family [Candidatus Saccharibacteria bacterium oral taxon 488]|jgi:type II secretion system protein E|nr:Flp pilus assembly complex ATPase component TadA [Candidatus Saccharibacteria bacterium]QJU11218.1 type II/IV secretion system protein [Candidatus Saccharibacteria bacterium oral taxon 488]QLF52106.1 Flp pilus assembly complex ATPase component TadA [Candidatus Saccharibacteria bacterium oral taxon 488]
MRISDSSIEKILRQGEVISESQLAELKMEAERTHHSLQTIILEHKILSEVQLGQKIGEYINVPFVTIEPKDIPDDVLKRIPEHIARQYNVVLFAADDNGVLSLAMEDPDDVQALNFIQKEIGYNIKVFLATKNNILDCLENYRGNITDELDEVVSIQSGAESDSQNVSEEEISENSPIAQTVNLLLEYAIKSGASDIHIEPREDFVQVRYRIDGVLKEVNKLPRNVQGALVSRIKILSNLKIDERRVPQDGRFKIKVSGKQYALRVSTLPIADGEKIVMRILDESNQAVALDSLGYWGLSLSTLKDAMAQPNGMILVTGPTGSGKSTSLFSVLSELNTPDVNISTIEDPVEYKIPGVNQTQTNSKAGMTFASGLRALLRQDPNIIMVGEIRDGETANLGVQAALTGHLVFSTLHTNNAATCLPRLLDMGIEPFLIASTVKAVIGQRLVRRLCMHCRQQYVPDAGELAYIVQMFNLKQGSMQRLHALEQQAAADKIGGNTPLGSTDVTIQYLWRPNPEGCDECGHNGFKGRVGIYEVLGISIPIQKMITANATSNEIQQQAITEGMVTMQTDGFVKSLRGVTTLEEVLRATREQ